MTAAGHPDDGTPGLRPEYGPTYFGAFVTDPDGNSVEAVHDRPARDDGTLLDHLWIRVADLAASTRFYEAVAPTVGYAVERLPDRTRIHGDGASVSVLARRADAGCPPRVLGRRTGGGSRVPRRRGLGGIRVARQPG